MLTWKYQEMFMYGMKGDKVVAVLHFSHSRDKVDFITFKKGGVITGTVGDIEMAQRLCEEL